MNEGNWRTYTNHRLENLNKNFKAVIKIGSTLIKFIISFFDFLKSKNYQTDYRTAKLFLKRPIFENLTLIEQDYRDVLSDKGFHLVKNELDEYSFIEMCEPSSNQSVLIHNAGVRCSVNACRCTCSFNLSYLLPRRHIFEYRALKKIPLFNEKLFDGRFDKSKSTQRRSEKNKCELQTICHTVIKTKTKGSDTVR